MDNNGLATILATIVTGIATILTSYGVMRREIATASATVSAAATASNAPDLERLRQELRAEFGGEIAKMAAELAGLRTQAENPGLMVRARTSVLVVHDGSADPADLIGVLQAEGWPTIASVGLDDPRCLALCREAGQVVFHLLTDAQVGKIEAAVRSAVWYTRASVNLAPLGGRVIAANMPATVAGHLLTRASASLGVRAALAVYPVAEAKVLTAPTVEQFAVATAKAVATAEAWRPEGDTADMGDVAPARVPTVLGAVREVVL